MTIKKRASQIVISCMIGTCSSLVIPATANAGYLYPPDTCGETSCRPAKVIRLAPVKKHYSVKRTLSVSCHTPKIKKHHRRHRRAHGCGCFGCEVSCVNYYIPQHEPVEFRRGPAPCGHYVNLTDCESYDPDRITGDDDPTIYPGMNIDN